MTETQTAETELQSAFTRCTLCSRLLTHPESVKRGMGPICSGRAYTYREYGVDKRTVADIDFDMTTGDVVCKRDQEVKYFNITQSVVHHSPDGFEWGYAGSGPAEFALNILNWYVPAKIGKDADDAEPYELPHKCFKGKCSLFAWSYHQQFKDRFITNLPPEGGTIKGDDIKAFIAEKKIEYMHIEADPFYGEESHPLDQAL